MQGGFRAAEYFAAGHADPGDRRGVVKEPPFPQCGGVLLKALGVEAFCFPDAAEGLGDARIPFLQGNPGAAGIEALALMALRLGGEVQEGRGIIRQGRRGVRGEGDAGPALG